MKRRRCIGSSWRQGGGCCIGDRTRSLPPVERIRVIHWPLLSLTADAALMITASLHPILRRALYTPTLYGTHWMTGDIHSSQIYIYIHLRTYVYTYIYIYSIRCHYTNRMNLNIGDCHMAD